MNTLFKKFFILAMFLCMYTSAFADLEITEIMYNPEGSDDGYEYIKIKNTGSVSIPISEYFFLENETHHGLYPEQETLSAGQSAFVVKDIDMAMSRYGSQNYIKSSFSLNNTGESIAFSDVNKSIIVTFAYTSEMGGDGDGNPLYAGVSGAVNDNTSESSSSSTSSSSSSSSNTESNTTSYREKYEPYYSAYIDIPDVVMAQSDFNIKAGVFFKKQNKDIHKKGGYYYINFGDGYAQEYRNRIDESYVYRNPGVYNLVLEYYKGSLTREYSEPNAFLEKTIKVVEPELSIIKFDLFSGLTIKNDTSEKIDIAGWHVLAGSDDYTFPKYSSVQAHSFIIIPQYNLGFSQENSISKEVSLLNASYIPTSFFTKKVYVKNKKTSAPQALVVSEKTSDNSDIVVGQNVLVEEGFFNNDSDKEQSIVFKEDDISRESVPVQKNTNNNLPLWILGGVTISLALLKSFVSKLHEVKKNTSSDEYNIKRID